MLSLRNRAGKRRGSPARVLFFGAALAGAFAGVCLSLVGIVWLLNTWRLLPPKSLPNPWRAGRSYEPAPDFRAARGVYPYSVVPGGVASAAEVDASMAHDPLVAEHYRGIHSSRLEPIRLHTTVVVYASFRTHTGVHWTSHAIRVPKGELVLSDGINIIRGRCGNRLSFLPPAELPPGELPPKLLVPRAPQPPVEPEPPEIVLEYGAPPVFNLPPGLPGAPSEPPATFWPPAQPPIVWCCALTVLPITEGQPNSPAPSTGVLEPASIFLLGTALSLAMLWWASGRRGTR